MGAIYTINYDKDYVFLYLKDALDCKEDLQNRFKEEEFRIDAIYEDDPEFREYVKYAE